MARYRKKKNGYTKEQDILFGSILIVFTIIGIISFSIQYKTIIINTLILVTILITIGIIIYFVKKTDNKINTKTNNKKRRYKSPQEIQEEIYQKQKRKQKEEEERKKYENVTFRKVHVEEKEEKIKITPEENKATTKEERKKIFEKNRKERYKKFKEENKNKGNEYEKQIGKFYKDLDYKVEYRGINLVKKDKGIDLIAEDEDEMLLIQCKNNQNSQIEQYVLRKFIGDCQTYKENNNINKKIRRIFVVAKNNLEYGAKKYIKENKKVWNLK